MENGKKLVTGIGIYLVAKAILNLIIGFSGGNVVSLVLAVVFAGALILGIKYANYVVAAILAFTVIWHFKDNVTNLPANLIYLIEGLLDIGVAALLVCAKDIKAHFGQDV